MKTSPSVLYPVSILSLLFAAACNEPKTETRKPETSFPVGGTVVRVDPALDSIVPASAKIEKIASGQKFTEGPIYVRDGYLLFSDIPQNAIFKWTPDGTVNVFRKPSGYDGNDAPAGALIGSNGITMDKEGRLVIAEHGNHRVTRLEKNGTVTVLAADYKGKRLNSPNDVVYKSDGALYFTDPPYGLPKEDDDPKKELKFNGIYRLKDGKLDLLSKELTRPNGIAFSPDEKYLYISNSDPARKIWMRFDVKPDGTLGKGKQIYDVTSQTEEGLPDGLKVDKLGNLYGSGPGGIWVFSPEGKYLGIIKPPETPANCAWGKYTEGPDTGKMTADEEAKTLYMTARTGVYRVQLNVAGIRP
jgi:gluconolactonase